MPQTFHLHARAVDVRPLDDCMLAIFNTETTDMNRYYELVRVAISDPAPISANTSGVGQAGKLQIFRTTAQSGGVAIAPIKHDTASASLPAAVLVVSNPDSVTTTGDPLRGIGDAPSYSIAATAFPVRNFGGYLSPYEHGHRADILRVGGSPTEPIVLREGEGIALTQTEAGVPHAMAIACMVTNYSTNATYMLRSRGICTDPEIGAGLFALFNGSGSGVVLGVKVMILPMDGESNLAFGCRVAKLSGMYHVGEELTPFAADTANSVPASLNCQIGPAGARLGGGNQGWQQDWQQGISATSIPLAQQQNAGVITRKTYSKDFIGIGSTVIQPKGQLSSLRDIELFKAKAGSGVKIIPGEGIGLLSGRAGVLDFSTFHVYNIEATVLHYPPRVSSRSQYHIGM